jgi:hypothetical protein
MRPQLYIKGKQEKTKEAERSANCTEFHACRYSSKTGVKFEAACFYFLLQAKFAKEVGSVTALVTFVGCRYG